MVDWVVLTNFFPGWSLEEIKSLSPRERKNWIDLSTGFRKAQVRI
jgi:hypothetical protein